MGASEEARLVRVCNAGVLVVAFLATLGTFRFLGWVLGPLDPFSSITAVVAGLSLLIFCGGFAVATWVVARLARSVFHLHTTLFE